MEAESREYMDAGLLTANTNPEHRQDDGFWVVPSSGDARFGIPLSINPNPWFLRPIPPPSKGSGLLGVPRGGSGAFLC